MFHMYERKGHERVNVFLYSVKYLDGLVLRYSWFPDDVRSRLDPVTFPLKAPAAPH